MIRLIGLDSEVFDNIIANYPEMIKDYYKRSLIITFKKECILEFRAGLLSITKGIDTLNILCIDFWRLEIE